MLKLLDLVLPEDFEQVAGMEETSKAPTGGLSLWIVLGEELSALEPTAGLSLSIVVVGVMNSPEPTAELSLWIVLDGLISDPEYFTGVRGECSGSENAFFVANSASRAFASSSQRKRLQPVALGLSQV